MEFRVKVLDGSSSVTCCVIDAVNEADARRQVALRNLRVISLEPARRLRRLLQAPQLQLAVFSQQLVSLLEAGLSLVEALEALSQKESNAGTRRTLERILLRLYEGQTLAAAISGHGAHSTPPHYCCELSFAVNRQPSTTSFMTVAVAAASESLLIWAAVKIGEAPPMISGSWVGSSAAGLPNTAAVLADFT